MNTPTMKHNLFFRILLAAASLMLAACGSGGADDSPALLKVEPTTLECGPEASEIGRAHV